MAASEAIGAIFSGGSASDAGTMTAFAMRIEENGNSMIKWRRFFSQSGSPMNALTGMVLSPDGATIACAGSVANSDWYHITWIWTIRSADGGFGSNVLEINHGGTG